MPIQCVYKRAVSNMSEFQKHVLCSGAENTKMKKSPQYKFNVLL